MKLTLDARSRAVVKAALMVAVLLRCAVSNAGEEQQQPVFKVKLPHGVIKGTSERVAQTTLRVFRGIPYAAPPTGEFRWREPQPVARWAGVRHAAQFGPRCMQPSDDELTFRSREMSEDCLYLNVWTPAADERAKLPVLVYFHGGRFETGDGSEPRYDGANLAARGMVTVTLNSRLGVFGFLAHQDAARESPQGAAGNYGFLDQHAALRWVRENIALFGGDPDQVTIAGQLAGSVAVSAHMASPLSRGLFARAIGESGSAFKPVNFWPKDFAEETATKFGGHLVTTTLSELRAVSAERLLQATSPDKANTFSFWPNIDGYFLPGMPESIFVAGAQAHVPLLLGNNSQESHFSSILKLAPPTPENWRKELDEMFFELTDELLALYPGRDEQEVMRSATAFATDHIIGHSMWRWMNLHRRTSGGAPVYYYLYTHPRPPEVPSGERRARTPEPLPVMGAVQGAEIEYVLGNLEDAHRYAWQPDDREVSRIFSTYITQFIKTGNPNTADTGNVMQQSGQALPDWPAVREERDGFLRQAIGKETKTIWDASAPRQQFWLNYLARFPLTAGLYR
ncbi:carboxylesterase family protein [Trinickia sp. LjRoot230]|uniref:carboxylesterase/lipase family protein n=1 Tax=Trinickia sp. LjRoot230 TaxID=3342288 RepID=UPI003ECD037D